MVGSERGLQFWIQHQVVHLVFVRGQVSVLHIFGRASRKVPVRVSNLWVIHLVPVSSKLSKTVAMSVHPLMRPSLRNWIQTSPKGRQVPDIFNSSYTVVKLVLHHWAGVVIVNLRFLHTHRDSAWPLRVVSLLLYTLVRVVPVLIDRGVHLELLFVQMLEVLSVVFEPWELVLWQLLQWVPLRSKLINEFIRILSWDISDENLIIFQRSIMVESYMVKSLSWSLVWLLHHTRMVASICGCCFVVSHHRRMVLAFAIIQICNIWVHNTPDDGRLLRITVTLLVIIQKLTLHLRHVLHELRLLRLKICNVWLHLLEKNKTQSQERFVIQILIHHLRILNQVQIQVNVHMRRVLLSDQLLIIADKPVDEIREQKHHWFVLEFLFVYLFHQLLVFLPDLI